MIAELTKFDLISCLNSLDGNIILANYLCIYNLYNLLVFYKFKIHQISIYLVEVHFVKTNEKMWLKDDCFLSNIT